MLCGQLITWLSFDNNIVSPMRQNFVESHSSSLDSIHEALARKKMCPSIIRLSSDDR
jgi:hypothetical protein